MKRALMGIVALAAAFLLLAIPAPRPPVAPPPAGSQPFLWNRDAFWHSLEARFAELRATGCDAADADPLAAIETAVTRLAGLEVGPESALLDTIERRYFEAGPAVAACAGLVEPYVRLQGALRAVLKDQSQSWNLATRAARERLYRLLYGTRAAVEEAILHHPGRVGALLPGRSEPSVAPGATVHGVIIHSGDMLVSRGGAPTSALIARGSDYPGNFSHVALVHVDSASGTASVIEAHIERGVAVATAEQYLADRKLRILVLRPRASLPQLLADPLLPHRAATLALERARSGHVPYDFTMDYTDASRLFCSEVASSVYSELGVTLWTGISTISAPGLRRWLAGFGVRHFETQEPSDLEYDPQLVVVAEWRDPESLLADHIDNAVIDAMLEGAERGDALTYPWYLLPGARLARAYGLAARLAGSQGPIPEGMSAGSALRNRSFSARQRHLAAQVSAQVEAFVAARGYPPPYWTLLDLAREARDALPKSRAAPPRAAVRSLAGIPSMG